jgi:isocitrate dehydrogenase
MKTITIAKGDGIGPEISDAVLKIIKASGVELNFEEVKVGKELYESGHESGIEPETWKTLERNKVFLKGPITTPQGGGYKSLNVTMRKALGLFANVRPVKAYAPYVHSFFPKMDLVIIRENEEDLYAGIEHQQTSEVIQCLKLISKQGSEAIIRYAFEYAKMYNRKKVTCMSKDNIMKMTDGAFHKIFNEVAKEYPEITTDHYIIDIGSALLADKPEIFDVIVTLNLYGDIISDIAAQVAGSVGLGGSANIGENFAMFEAIHGSAPDIAGKGIANPSGMLNAACMMLVHLGEGAAAEKIKNALICTLEDGIHTGDIYREGESVKKVGTMEFADAVIERLGKSPQKLKPVHYGGNLQPIKVERPKIKRASKVLQGVDIFLDWVDKDGESRNPEVLGKIIDSLPTQNLKLKMISNRGQKVYPDGNPSTYCTDHWRCRYLKKSENAAAEYSDVLKVMEAITNAGLNIIKSENLYEIDGQRAYSLGQGE